MIIPSAEANDIIREIIAPLDIKGKLKYSAGHMDRGGVKRVI